MMNVGDSISDLPQPILLLEIHDGNNFRWATTQGLWTLSLIKCLAKNNKPLKENKSQD